MKLEATFRFNPKLMTLTEAEILGEHVREWLILTGFCRAKEIELNVIRGQDLADASAVRLSLKREHARKNISVPEFAREIGKKIAGWCKEGSLARAHLRVEAYFGKEQGTWVRESSLRLVS